MAGEPFVPAVVRPRWLSQPFYIPPERIELLKWVGLAAMLTDHASAHLFNEGQHNGTVFYVVGRLAFPLFALALASGLATAGRETARHTALRLVAWGVVAQLATLLVRDYFAFNVLFTLAAGIAAWLVETSQRQLLVKLLLWSLLFLASSVAEYVWIGAAFVWLTIRWAHLPTYARTLAMIFGAAALWVVNGNFVALAALPLAWLLALSPIEVPRIRRFFYAAYVGQYLLFYAVRSLL